MKTITLSRGQIALVDDEDFQRSGHFKWSALKDRSGNFYAVRSCGKRQIRLHREIVGAEKGVIVDHWNHETLDCRRKNLRVCSPRDNNRNRRSVQRNSTSGARGVFWVAKRWMAQIGVDGKQIYLGRFVVKADAIDAYAAANRKHFGEFGGNCA